MLCLAIAMMAMVVMAQEKKRGLWACKSIDEKKVRKKTWAVGLQVY